MPEPIQRVSFDLEDVKDLVTAMDGLQAALHALDVDEEDPVAYAAHGVAYALRRLAGDVQIIRS